MKRQFLFLIFILLLAAFLRFYHLGANPPSLTWDEASWGYNAYSLGIDGKDEFGKFLPIQYLESFGDFKPPLYAYLDVLPVKIFGLNEFAVRFPSAFFGVLTVLITYFLVKRIFPKAQQFSIFNFQFSIGEMSAFLLAISPWHINLSRAAFEANVATFFVVLGVFLFLTAVSSRGVASFTPLRCNSLDTSGFWLLLSAVSFVLSMYTFNTARAVAPLLILGLSIGFRRQLLAMKRQVLLAVVIGAVFAIPLAQFLITPQAQLRFHEVNIFSDIGIIERTNQEVANDKAWLAPLSPLGDFTGWSRILHNRRLAYGVEYLKHYFDHFNPGFLFIKGDGNPKFSTQDVGQLYLWDLPFLVAGILLLLRKREGFWWVIPFWLLVGIIPAATARETPHALRIETTLPMFQISIAIGIVSFISWIKKIKVANNFKFLIVIFTFSFLIFNFIYYYHGYYTHYPREYSSEWQYGYREAVEFLNKEATFYDKIVFTEALGRPYIYGLFYNKENPKVFRETAKISREAFGFVHVEEYGEYVFIKDPTSVRTGDKVLYVDVPSKVPAGASILKTFFLLNGQPVLVAYSL